MYKISLKFIVFLVALLFFIIPVNAQIINKLLKKRYTLPKKYTAKYEKMEALKELEFKIYEAKSDPFYPRDLDNVIIGTGNLLYEGKKSVEYEVKKKIERKSLFYFYPFVIQNYDSDSIKYYGFITHCWDCSSNEDGIVFSFEQISILPNNGEPIVFKKSPNVNWDRKGSATFSENYRDWYLLNDKIAPTYKNQTDRENYARSRFKGLGYVSKEDFVSIVNSNKLDAKIYYQGKSYILDSSKISKQFLVNMKKFWDYAMKN